jgi:hypothetical protein
MFAHADDTTLIRLTVVGGTALAAAVYAFPFLLIGGWLVLPG